MTPEQAKSIIKAGESQTIEFKTAMNAVPKSVYEKCVPSPIGMAGTSCLAGTSVYRRRCVSDYGSSA